MDWLSLLCVWSTLFIVSASMKELSRMQCHHEPAKIIAGVKQKTDGRSKRQISHEPIRIHFHYDSTVNTMLSSFQSNRLQTTVIPQVGAFLESSLSVIRTTNPLLLERGCEGSFFVPPGDPMECVTQCDNTPTCGIVSIPTEHLKRCVECGGGGPSNCGTRPGTVDGPGIPDTDLVIYVAADCSFVPSGVIAFASSCQLESELDRPFAGYISFCPSQFPSLSDDLAIRVGIHEVMHVLAFSPSLYPYWRDEAGNPRTQRDMFGSPPNDASTDTLRTVTYNDWSTRNGVISRQVTHLVTPNAIEQARLHYNCPSITGVELENQGGSGTSSAHWEQRIMGNEGMTGFLLFGAPFSRITFGLLEDSGWYRANYAMADALAWGLNTGCTIPQGSCREYITQQQASGGNISPYCVDVDDTTRGCTVDHGSMSLCNLDSTENPPTQFQYFDASAGYGGRLETADHCPFEDDVSGTECSEPSNVPTVNNGGQLYGASSRCFLLGRDWTRTDNLGTSGTYTLGSGCYQYSCTSSGVEIILEGVSFPCSCEGEEILVDITVAGVRYQGSYICPSCAAVCYDELENCPMSEPAPCPGQVTVPDPCLSNPCDDNAVCTRDSPQNSNFSCACTPPFVGDGFSCEAPPATTPPATTPAATTPPATTSTTPPPTILDFAFSQSAYTVEEGESTAEVCINLVSGVSSRAVSITLTTSVGTATSDDYTSTSSAVTFSLGTSAGGAGSQMCINIPIIDDMLVEAIESFSVIASSMDAEAMFPSGSNASVLINDNDIPMFQFTQTSYTVIEGSGPATLMIELTDRMLTFPINVTVIDAVGGSATDGADYTGVSTVVTFPANSGPGTQRSFDIPITDDTFVESMETINLQASAASPGQFMTGGDTATVIIIDNNVPDPCLLSPCDDNAVCTRDSPQNSNFSCVCTPPFVGDGFSCEVPDPCLLSPCDDNAVCTRDSPQNSNFSCACTPPFVGDGFSCEVPDPCLLSPCDDNAVCTRDSPQNSNFSCACTPPFVGDGFSCEVPDPCLLSPCDDNAVCTRDSPQNSNFSCACTPSFIGNGFFCEVPNPCLLSPCDDNAVCTRDSLQNSNFSCACTPPFVGDGFSCEAPLITTPTAITLVTATSPPIIPDPCLSNPCDLNALCKRESSESSNFICSCISPYEGDGFTCQIFVYFEQTEYSVSEAVADRNLALQICLLIEDSPSRFDIEITTDDILNDDFDILSSSRVIQFQAASGRQRRCSCIDIRQDFVDEDNEVFAIIPLSPDPAIGFTTNRANLTIIDDDDFSLHFINDSPRINGTSVEIEFSIGTSFHTVMCRFNRFFNCMSGKVTTIMSQRTRPTGFTVRAEGPGNVVIELIAIFRADNTLPETFCWLHPINQGITVDGASVNIEWQATGPSVEQRNTQFQCFLNNQPTSSDSCTAQGFSMSGLSPGSYSLIVRPLNQNCSQIRGRLFQFMIL